MSPMSLKVHFGFITEPFSKEIATKALFISEQLKALFARLQHFIARRGIARQLNLNAKFFKWQLVPELKAAIEKNFAAYHKTTFLIIDDAQHLKPSALEELRLLTNFRIDSQAPLSLVLLAQPEFRKLVQLQALEAFRQRLTLRIHLTGLAQSEAAAYVKHQLEIAGRTDTLFTDDVIAEIYQQAKGIPRLINTLCYECLLDIYRQQKNVVDLPTLEKVLCQYDNW